MSYAKVLTNGILKENPLFVMVLGCCPALAVTTSGINGLGMGLASTFVLVCSNTLVSLLKNVIPDKVRIPAFIVVIATFVTIVDMLMEAFTPDLYNALGIFIPLIVVNCVILGRAEAFAQKKSVLASVIDGIGMGIGFTLALTVFALIREILGNGSVFDIKFLAEDAKTILIFILPPGAFITFGFLIVLFNELKKKFN